MTILIFINSTKQNNTAFSEAREGYLRRWQTTTNAGMQVLISNLLIKIGFRCLRNDVSISGSFYQETKIIRFQGKKIFWYSEYLTVTNINKFKNTRAHFQHNENVNFKIDFSRLLKNIIIKEDFYLETKAVRLRNNWILSFSAFFA